jgi:hypothetical protein
VIDKEQVLWLQVPVYVTSVVEQGQQFKHFDSHGQHGGWVARDLKPFFQCDTAVEDHVGKKAVAVAADEPTIGIVIGVHKLRQAQAEGLFLVKAPLEEVVLLVKEEPAIEANGLMGVDIRS